MMILPASAPSARNNLAAAAHSQSPRRGFTLVELLAVIFIIALLTFLILGAVHRAQRSSKISKTKADLAAIATALEQYHSDFKTYPGMAEPITLRTILAQALIGPGPAKEDGAEGPGFRIPNIGQAPGTLDPSTKHWPAYLSPEHFQVKRFEGDGLWTIFDYFGNPIRYYPKRRNFNPKQGPLVGSGAVPAIFAYEDGELPGFGCSAAMENSGQIISQATLQKHLGDDNGNNLIDGAETFQADLAFILASSGPDGVFTQVQQDPKLNKSDDITNSGQR